MPTLANLFRLTGFKLWFIFLVCFLLVCQTLEALIPACWLWICSFSAERHLWIPPLKWRLPGPSLSDYLIFVSFTSISPTNYLFWTFFSALDTNFKCLYIPVWIKGFCVYFHLKTQLNGKTMPFLSPYGIRRNIVGLFRAQSSLEISRILSIFLSVTPETTEFMLIRWLRVGPLGCLRVRLVNRKTKQLQSWNF